VNPTVAKMAGQIALSLVRSKAGRRLVIAVLVLQLIALTVILWLPTYFASITASSVQRTVTAAAPSSNCGAETSVTIAEDGSPLPRVSDLTPKQVEVARTIYYTTLGVGKSLKWSAAKTERAVLVALATAKQESQLGAYPGFDRPNADGDAGVFQQRQKPGWYGTLRQVNQVGYAATVFLRGKKVTAADVAAARRAGSSPAGPEGYTIPGLQQKRGWEDMSITEAAQAVQVSAYPLAYAPHERLARTLLGVFKEKLDPQSVEAQVTESSMLCGPAEAKTCPPTGKAAESGLKPDALRVLRCTARSWPAIRAFGGVGGRSNVSDHPAGNAVDIMIPEYSSPAGVAQGDEVARWLLASRKQLGVKYVIWNERIWSVARQAEGWRNYCTSMPCDNDSNSHRNHVHVSTYGDSAGSDVIGGPGGSDGPATSSGPAVLPLSRVSLTARFGQCSSLWANCHTGLDMSAGVGTPIRAVLGGRVVSSGWAGAYGQLTKIEARPGLQFWYAHQSARSVRVGETVSTGQVIGRVGATGNVTGPHLHLEVRQRGKKTDPEAWLRKQGLLGG
jgi:murein DD-endopeptidase MepM/ murein hydrolase activator NlpD